MRQKYKLVIRVFRPQKPARVEYFCFQLDTTVKELRTVCSWKHLYCKRKNVKEPSNKKGKENPDSRKNPRLKQYIFFFSLDRIIAAIEQIVLCDSAFWKETQVISSAESAIWVCLLATGTLRNLILHFCVVEWGKWEGLYALASSVVRAGPLTSFQA